MSEILKFQNINLYFKQIFFLCDMPVVDEVRILFIYIQYIYIGEISIPLPLTKINCQSKLCYDDANSIYQNSFALFSKPRLFSRLFSYL